VVFFFQAEDGIRDFHVTGVQTCALPILGLQQHVVIGADAFLGRQVEVRAHALVRPPLIVYRRLRAIGAFLYLGLGLFLEFLLGRSEERRVGKECRSRWWTEAQRRVQRLR